jgi:biopolymer transport protein ExbD
MAGIDVGGHGGKRATNHEIPLIPFIDFLLCLVAFLNGKTQSMEDDINEASVTVLNLVVSNRQKVNLQGIEGL